MTAFAQTLAEKCVQAHKDHNKADFLHLRDRAGVAVLSVSPKEVHCPPNTALELVRRAVAGFVEEGIEEGRRQAGTPSPEALAAAREEGRRGGWAEALAVVVRHVETRAEAVETAERKLNQATDEWHAVKVAQDAIRREAP